MKKLLQEGFYKSPLGIIKILADEKGIVKIDFSNSKKIKTTQTDNRLIKDCISQLDEYFKGERRSFQLRLNLIGTEFQKKVWKELLKIPFGKMVSYLDVARKIKNEKAVRAVGQAIGKNPVSIVVPCHRVIGSNGELTGYASGLWRKKWLLEHENQSSDLR